MKKHVNVFSRTLFQISIERVKELPESWRIASISDTLNEERFSFRILT
jgi:hypothetical protein